MKRFLSIVLIIAMMISIVGCASYEGSVVVETEEKIIKITLDNFSGEEEIKIDHEGIGEGTLFCSVLITEGKLKAVRKNDSIFSRDQEFFDVDAKDGRKNDGVYVEEKVKNVTLILTSDEETSGIVYLCFERNVVNNLPYDCFIEE